MALFSFGTLLSTARKDSTHIFKVYTRDSITWQFTEVLPYEIEIAKYIVGIRKDRPDRLKVMHRWAEDRSDNGDTDGSTNAADEAAQTACPEEIEEVQRAYNPGTNDSRRRDHRLDEIRPANMIENSLRRSVNQARMRRHLKFEGSLFLKVLGPGRSLAMRTTKTRIQPTARHNTLYTKSSFHLL
jgi:hypothetical protein